MSELNQYQGVLALATLIVTALGFLITNIRISISKKQSIKASAKKGSIASVSKINN